MASLVLKFEGRTIQEYGLGLMVMIGRAPDNSLAIDNPAVSTHHACVFRDGSDFVVEDMESTNGTFVNQKRVTRRKLQDGDVILVGKHTMEFRANGGGQVIDTDGDGPTIARLGDTVFLDTKQHRALLAKLMPAQAQSVAAADEGKTPASNAAVSLSQPAVLRVVAGRADQSEYSLDGRTTLIGKADAARIRLRGWFKPAVAVAIARSHDGYVAMRIGGKTSVNGFTLKGRRELRDGDVLRVGGLELEFRSPHSSPRTSSN